MILHMHNRQSDIIVLIIFLKPVEKEQLIAVLQKGSCHVGKKGDSEKGSAGDGSRLSGTQSDRMSER